MVNMELLKSKINESGMTMVSIAEKVGVLRETLYNRLNGAGDFKASEIEALTRVLRLTRDERDKIFFANNVECNSSKINPDQRGA